MEAKIRYGNGMHTQSRQVLQSYSLCKGWPLLQFCDCLTTIRRLHDNCLLVHEIVPKNCPQNRPWNCPWFFPPKYKIDIILAIYFNQLLNKNISQVQTSELKNLLTFIKPILTFEIPIWKWVKQSYLVRLCKILNLCLHVKSTFPALQWTF